MKIYHGSKAIIKKPLYKGSEINNDYGPAFYTTIDFENACIWASKNNSVGYVNEYEISFDDLKILDLTNKEKYSVLNWIAILLSNRSLEHSFSLLNRDKINKIIDKYAINLEEYDVVIGYRADDAYFRFPKEFVIGNLSLEDLEEIFRLGSLGTQYVFVSQKAIDKLKFKKATLVDEKYVGRYFKQVKDATSLFDEILKKSIDGSVGTRIGDLLK